MSDQLPCATCKSECCSKVPMTRPQVEGLLRWLIENANDQILKLKQQERPAGKCMFVDMETHRCSVYPVRPGICKAFGYYGGTLTCWHAPHLAKGDMMAWVREYWKELGARSLAEFTQVGDLFTWADVEVEAEAEELIHALCPSQK